MAGVFVIENSNTSQKLYDCRPQVTLWGFGEPFQYSTAVISIKVS